MPLSDRDYIRGKHPPNCTCVDCTNERLGIRSNQEKKSYPIYEGTPKSEFHDKKQQSRQRRTPEQQPEDNNTQNTTNRNKGKGHRTPKFFIALLLILSLSLCGFGISLFVGNTIPLIILFGFSFLYSIEKWYRISTTKNKIIGKFYRLILNLAILSILGLLIWSGIQLFSQQFFKDQIIGSLIFIAELVFFVWMWRIVAKNSWRWPSMKLTIFSLIILFIVFAYAGVEPIKSYKDTAFSNIGSFFSNLRNTTTETQQTASNPTPWSTSSAKPTITTASITPSPTASQVKTEGIDEETGIYKDYYLGLVKTPEGVLNGNSCYGEFIILINNKNAKNPTYAELLDFLKSDNTDMLPYLYTLSLGGFYYGEAEDKIDLDHLKKIIDGVIKPSSPKVCADFAERLHNNAEKAGIRCAYVSLDMVGYTDPNNLGIESDAGHACNAFQTTDKGLIYIDCTGMTDSIGPINNDTIVDIAVGEEYNPEFIFPSGGWYIPTGEMGVVTNIFVTWDGDWR